MKKVGLLFLLIALVLPYPVTAQEWKEWLEPLPACTAPELNELDVVVTEVANNMTYINVRMDMITSLDDLADLVLKVDELQREWYAEIVPDLPDCRMALIVHALVGHYYSEILITTLLLDGGYGQDVLIGHLTAIDDLSQEFIRLGTE